MLPISATDLLPQQFPFQMIDTLTQSDDILIQTEFTIQHENVLVQDGLLCEGGLIENMAQSAAAGTGYKAKLNGQVVPKGYIGAVKNVNIHRLPLVGEKLTTELKSLYQVGQANVVEGKIFSNKETLASCELTIFVNQ